MCSSSDVLNASRSRAVLTGVYMASVMSLCVCRCFLAIKLVKAELGSERRQEYVRQAQEAVQGRASLLQEAAREVEESRQDALALLWELRNCLEVSLACRGLSVA